MQVKVGTFNLNNLFSRFNFNGMITALRDGHNQMIKTFIFSDPSTYSIRIDHGRLVEAKSDSNRRLIAQRILAMDLDVLAVQEVEDITVLDQFAANELQGRYRYRVLVEGNDRRLIDIGLLSKLPIGAVTSWRHAVHPAEPLTPVFSRDLLQVEILHPATRKRLFTLFNNHFKSQLVMPGQDPATTRAASDLKRKCQAETAAHIIAAEMRPDSPFIVVGDMNFAPDAAALLPLVQEPCLGLSNALAQARETVPAPQDTPQATTPVWTHRYKEAHQPARYELFDQIWVSPSLAPRQTAAWILRRTKLSGDGSDHDPAWIELVLD